MRKIPRWRMRAISQVGEPIMSGDAVSVAAKEALSSLAHEAEMFVFRERHHRRVRATADSLCRLTARAIELAIVEIIIA